MIITNDWYDIAMNIIGKVKHASSQDEDGQGYVSMKLILTSEHIETDDGNVHDIAETFVSLHSEELDDLLTFKDVRDYIIEQAIDNEKHIRTYKTERGLYNFIKKMIHSDDAFALVRC